MKAAFWMENGNLILNKFEYINLTDDVKRLFLTRNVGVDRQRRQSLCTLKCKLKLQYFIDKKQPNV